jgi:type VI secretion system secreted protein VgrG
MPDDNGVTSSRAQLVPKFAFEVTGVDESWVVARATVREALSAPFDAVVEVAAPDAAAPAELLGKACLLTFQLDSLQRRFAGVVTAVADRGMGRDGRFFEVHFAPGLALLAHSAHYRIWHGADALRIVREVLDGAKLYPDEQLRPPLGSAPDAPSSREYCTQFGESDLDFVRRLLADEGLLFAFDANDDGEVLELFDGRDGNQRPETPALTPGALFTLVDGHDTVADEVIRPLTVVASVTTSHVGLRDYDFTHPQAPLAAGTPQKTLTIERYPGRFVLGPYRSGDNQYDAGDLRRTARIELQRHTSGAEVLRSEGTAMGMRAGTTFEVAERGERALEGTFLLTAVVHFAQVPDTTRGGAASSGGPSERAHYRNTFECVPVKHVWAPPPPRRARADHPQVAVVTAERGSDEEIVTDHYGRVLVRFPWDRTEPEPRRREAPPRTSCWLRVMQPWAGSDWGFHFTPRVGMEVVVHFLDGDPDRPYVAGCLPNAANVPPLELPRRKTQSTIRTHSSPTTGGFNELRFEDAADHEEVYLRAQRDFVAEVLHDRAQTVGHDERLRVRRDSTETIGRNRTLTVDAAETHVVRKNRHVSVGESQLVQVVGNASLIVHQTVTTHADEAWRTTANDVGSLEVGGGSGTAIQMTPDEIQVRAPKKMVVGVGDDVTSEMTTEAFAVKAPKRIALECGQSRLVIEEDRIELVTKSGAKVVIDGDKIDIVAGGTVKLKGSEVKSNG